MDAALEELVRARGASLGEWLGTRQPLRFSNLAAEYRAAREGCAVWVADFRAFIAGTGDDRRDFLQGMLSNDVKALVAGQGVAAAFLTQQGKIVADMRVLADPDRFLLDVIRERAEPLMAAIGKYIVADDVELALAPEQPLCGFSGPGAASVLSRLLEPPPAEWRAFHHEARQFRSDSVRVVAVPEAGGESYLVAGESQLAGPLFAAAVGAGATPVGVETLDVLRVEAGVPLYGIDMDEDVLIMEAGLEQALSFTKGCYLGQEVVERVSARGHVNKKLAGLLIDGDVSPPAGALLRSDERDVGRLTSAVRSPRLERIIGLGFVHRDYLAPGTRLTVVAGSSELGATVTTLGEWT